MTNVWWIMNMVDYCSQWTIEVGGQFNRGGWTITMVEHCGSGEL